MTNLRITLVQSKLHWENIDENLKMFSERLALLKGKTDLIILPEMFTTGFSMNAEMIAESMEGSAFQWMKKEAATLDCAITGSLIIKKNDQYFNRLIFMKPDGQYSTYDKRHLFTLAKEHHTYQAGAQRLVVEWKDWKICPLVCYDLRFPVWSRNTEDYDLLLYVANWPETRSLHWKTLLQARAIENQCYTVGVNRVGEDEKGFVYSGDSALIDYYGTRRYSISKQEDVFTTSISKQEQLNYRAKLNFLPDRDTFEVQK